MITLSTRIHPPVTKKAWLRIDASDALIDAETIGAIWNRRRERPKLLMAYEAQVELSMVKECNASLDSFFSLLHGAVWVSSPSAVRSASSKAEQLYRAAGLGFNIPESCFTNDRRTIQEFMEAMGGDGSIVYKPHTSIMIRRGDGDIDVVYTRRLTRRDLNNHAITGEIPGIYQRYVPKRFDYRVTVVGSHLFACRIWSQQSEFSTVDVRAQPWKSHPLRHEPVELDPVVSRQCIKLVQSYGLAFGAIDLAEDDDGRMFFLELNPNGQWAWIEEATELPIASAICDIFESAASRSVS